MKTKKKSSIEVSKNSENEDIKLSNRIIDLFIWYQIEDSNAWLRVLESQVKFLEERRKQLFDNLDMCLFKFQKKKINEELEQIEKELFKQYEKIGEEVDIMNKLKSAISNNNDIKEVDDDTLLSYYDLLTYLKFGITFKKVSYKKFNREVIYFYDDEGNYIIENQNDKDNVFDTYLSECESDNTKFDRNIKILEK
jgi:hypothetical protein